MHLETIEERAKKEALLLVKEVCSEIIEFIFIYILFCYSLKHYQRYNPCYKIDFYLSSFVPFFTVGNQWQSGWKFYIDWRQTGLQNIEAFELDPFHLGSHHSSCRFSAWSVENCRDIGCRVLRDSAVLHGIRKLQCRRVTVFTLDLILPIVFAFLAKLDHSRSNTKNLSFPSLGGGGAGWSDIKTEISIFFWSLPKSSHF